MEVLDVVLFLAGLLVGSVMTVAVVGRPVRERWAAAALPMLPVPSRAPAPPVAVPRAVAPAPVPAPAPAPVPAAAPASVPTAAPAPVRGPAVTRGDARPLTTAALEALTGEGWIVLRDLPGAWGVREHVVIGPAGLFLLDSRALDGEITVDGDHVTALRDGERYRRDVGGRVRANAVALFRDLRHRGGVIEPVSSIVVLWGDFPATRTDGTRVTFVSGAALADHLRSRPVRLAADQVASLAAALQRTAATLAA